MSEAQEETREEPVDETGSPNLFDSLRERREEVASTHSTTFAVPGYKGNLYVEYRLLDQKQVNDIVKRAQKAYRKDEAQAEVTATVDMLIAACVQFLGRVDGEEMRPLHEVAQETDIGNFPAPIRYDSQLAEVLAYKADTAREAVMGLFGGNELSIISHGRALQMWFANTNSDVDLDFLGEA